MNESISPMKAIDFFCGAGGLTRGLLDAGIDVVGGFDVDEACCQTYEKNNRNSRFLAKDINDIDLLELKRLTDSRSFGDFLFAGCAPCQPFSKQRRGPHKHQDATLLLKFGDLVAKAKPAAVVVENVPGIAKVKGFSTFKRFLKTLRNAKYDIDYNVLDAKAFGVPQNRKRLVAIAVRKGKASLPTPIYDGRTRNYTTVRQAIDHFPEIKAGEEHSTIPNHVAANVEPINIERLKATPPDGGDRRSWPDKYVLECHSNGHVGHTDVYGRLFWDKPSPTLTSKCYSISNGRYAHPEQHRGISLREAASLQTFPDGYEFIGPRTHIAKQIGNAVPVIFAEALGRHVRKMVR